MKLKEKVSALIEYLNRPERDGKTYNPNERVLIGDVLQKYDLYNWTKTNDYDGDEPITHIDLLLTNWERCGFNKSLNDIFSGEIETKPLVQFKDKDAQNLFNFLWEMFEKEITTNN